MRSAVVFAAVSLLVVCVCSQKLGVDLYAASPVSTWRCLKQAGFTYAIPRAYRSNNKIDTNVIGNINNAWAAGFSWVDVYMFPCPRCGNPAKQVNTLVDYLSKNQTRYGRVWVDVEMKDDYWMSSIAANRAFFETVVQTLDARRVSIGVYTSKSQWEPIMGSNYTRGSQYPLWYARYNNQINFNHFRAFGGWARPYIKQYVGDTTVCGVDIDKNYMP